MKRFIIALLILGFLPLSASAQSYAFEDVYSEHINREAIEDLKNEAIIQGYKDGFYKPENRINRAEFTKILIETKFDEEEINNCISNNIQSGWSYVYFKDVPKNEWFAKYVCMAKKNGIIDGYPDGTFKPANYINFAEASKIIAEAMDAKGESAGTNNEWFAPYVKGLEAKKAIPPTVQFFDKEITRGEMAESIWRLKENRTDKVSPTYEEITSPFPAIGSCEALKEKFMEYESYTAPPYYRTFDAVPMFDDVMEETAAPMAKSEATAGASAPADDYSETNVQVSGVDEADIIKNDGKYIYLLKGNTVRIVEAYPPEDMKEVAMIEFENESFYPQEMYVDDDKLVVIGNANSYYWSEPKIMENARILPPYPYHSTQTNVYIYDISDRSEPQEERLVVYDGHYNSSRRINENLYLILNANPDVWALEDVSTGEEILPQVKDGDNEPEAMVGCTDIHYFPGHFTPRYLMVSSIPLDDPAGKIEREVFLGSSENVYSSRTHLYVATNAINYDRYTDWDWRRDHAKTHVYRFSLDDGEIEFKARGEVPGKILNQFSMDAYKDNFRIATTKGNTWDEESPSTNNVYVLDTDMEVVGQLEDLAPGERIYSTRFLGDRLYMVTFRQVDPLFVIDLTNATAPKVLGKLKIPGFSNYIHPYDEDHIIGFGKDTEVNEKDQALMQGMKIAIFDVSDVANPKQQFTEIIGDRGTDSELLNNHKALLFDKEKNLLAFPVRIQEKITPEEMECGKYRYSTCPRYCTKRCIPSSCTEDAEGVATCTTDCDGLGSCTAPSYDRYETTFSGALVYKISLDKGFEQRGRITHYDEEDILKMGDYWPYNYEKQIQRIIYIGNYLYSISQGMVKGSTMDTVEEVNKVPLEE